MTLLKRAIGRGVSNGWPDWTARIWSAGRRYRAWLRQPRLPPTRFPSKLQEPVRLLVGPTNSAGQGWMWAQACARQLSGVGARTFSVRRADYGFPDDYSVDVPDYGHPVWQRRHEMYVMAHFTHVLLESMRPLFGTRHGRDAAGDIRKLQESGISPALVMHGSEIRAPSGHLSRERWSPFGDDDLSRRLEVQAQRFRGFAAEFGGPVFVSTPDLLLDLPFATWLPIVIDVDRWAGTQPAMRRSRPVVVHAPSNPRFKGSRLVDRVIEDLASHGAVDYRRIEGVPNSAMPAVLAEADIVIDQLVMGLYGVAACEAMAAGRVVVSYVGDHVRTNVEALTGWEVPIVEANPETLADVLTGLLDNREAAEWHANQGPSFVRAVHDGRRSAAVLERWLAPAQ